MELLRVQGLKKSFKGNEVLKSISFKIRQGECFGLVGTSGCGKTTAARIIAGFESNDEGTVEFMGKNLAGKRRKEVYKDMQMIFQNPFESFNPRMQMGKSLMEPYINFGYGKQEAYSRMIALMDKTGIDESMIRKYPHEISGGECQRCAIVRALMLSPQLLICDEITSALDVSVQAQIAALIMKLRKEEKLSLLFISHDLALVNLLCDRIAVMEQGIIIEEGIPEQIIEHPQNEYTKKLVSSIMEV